VQWLTHRRGTLALIAFAAQLLLPLSMIVIASHFGFGGCPRSAAVNAEADRFDRFVTFIDLGLLITVTVALFWLSAGRWHRYRWLIITLVPALALAGLTRWLSGLETLSLCNAFLLP
jgi:hypothetical protein